MFGFHHEMRYRILFFFLQTKRGLKRQYKFLRPVLLYAQLYLKSSSVHLKIFSSYIQIRTQMKHFLF